MFGFFKKREDPQRKIFREQFEKVVSKLRDAEPTDRAFVGHAINLAHSEFIRRFASVAAFKSLPDAEKMPYIEALSEAERKFMEKGDLQSALGLKLFGDWAAMVASGDEALARQFQEAMEGMSREGDSLFGPTSPSPKVLDDAALLRPLLALAKQGDASAQYNVGVMYDKGQGTKQDYASAMSWYRRAAEQGHVLAQVAVGAKYFDGTLGVAQDYKEALEWFLRAAKQGHALARVNLGMMFGNGLGVPRDHAIALMWMILAAETSEDEHRDRIVKLREASAKKMTPAQIAEAQRLAREWKPR